MVKAPKKVANFLVKNGFKPEPAGGWRPEFVKVIGPYRVLMSLGDKGLYWSISDDKSVNGYRHTYYQGNCHYDSLDSLKEIEEAMGKAKKSQLVRVETEKLDDTEQIIEALKELGFKENKALLKVVDKVYDWDDDTLVDVIMDQFSDQAGMNRISSVEEIEGKNGCYTVEDVGITTYKLPAVQATDLLKKMLKSYQDSDVAHRGGRG